MMRMYTVLSLLLAATYTGTAAAGPKKKKAPPPPVPTYWIGSFWADASDEGKEHAGTVSVKGENAPAEAILVHGLDKKHVVTTAAGKALDGKPGMGYAASYVAPPEVLTSWPTVVVVDAASGLQPKLIGKAGRSIISKLRKKTIKETESPEVDYWDGALIDLDADGVGDLALFYGCLGGIDGVCASNANFFYERDGSGWKRIYIEE